MENHLTKRSRGSAVENHLTKRARGRCIGEPSHQKNQGKVQLRTIPPKEPGEGAVENHPTKRTRGMCSGEPSHQKNQGKVYWRTIPPKEPGEGAVQKLSTNLLLLFFSCSDYPSTSPLSCPSLIKQEHFLCILSYSSSFSGYLYLSSSPPGWIKENKHTVKSVVRQVHIYSTVHVHILVLCVYQNRHGSQPEIVSNNLG